MKIYTKTGDKGETGLLGGVRVSKSHLAIEVCGCLDELNSAIGLACSFLLDEAEASEQVASLTEIQGDLFDIGSCVAACLSETSRKSRLGSERSAELETLIDQIESGLEPMTAFILPNGSTAGCHLHMARAVCRKCERRLVSLIELLATENTAGAESKKLTEAPEFHLELVFLNRLSDLLFVMARGINQVLERPETKWLPK